MSWVIVSKETGKAVAETWKKSVADAVNLDRYTSVPIVDWLSGLNKCGG